MSQRAGMPSSIRVTGTLLFLAALTAWPASAQEVRRPRPMNHDLTGHTDCFTCHYSLPDGHEGRKENVCLWCHAFDSPMLTTTPPTIGHPVEDREACLTCHGQDGPRPVPEDHEGRGNQHCLMCHDPPSVG